MENEELEVQPAEVEETQQTEQESTAEGEDKEVDWKAEALKYKAIAERKSRQVEKTKEEIKKTNNELTRDEVVLISKGYSDDDINVIKKIQAGAKAMGEEISILEAMEDPLFKAFKEKQDNEKKSEQAQLGASGGSGNYVEQKFTNGQTRDEHKKLWEEEMKKY